MPFGDCDNVLLKMMLAPIEEGGYHPTVAISTEDATFTFRVDIHIMNPFNDEIDAMIMQSEFKAFMKFSIDENFKLFSHADDITVDFTKIDAYFKTKVTKEQMNGRISWLRPIAVGGLNTRLDKGFSLPIP